MSKFALLSVFVMSSLSLGASFLVKKEQRTQSPLFKIRNFSPTSPAQQFSPINISEESPKKVISNLTLSLLQEQESQAQEEQQVELTDCSVSPLNRVYVDSDRDDVERSDILLIISKLSKTSTGEVLRQEYDKACLNPQVSLMQLRSMYCRIK